MDVIHRDNEKLRGPDSIIKIYESKMRNAGIIAEDALTDAGYLKQNWKGR